MKTNLTKLKFINLTAICVLVSIVVAVPVGVFTACSSSDETADTTAQSVFAEETDADVTTSDDEVTTGEGETATAETDSYGSDGTETNDTSEGTVGSAADATTDSAIDTTTSAPVETTSRDEETTAKPIETTAAEDTTKKPAETTASAETTTPDEETEPPVKVVGRANPQTGISWDGVSPIIYTYPDGTTGTEVRVGATFEYLPGQTRTVAEYDLPADPSAPKVDLTVCSDCGKKAGDGTNGTCISYWTGGDHTCENCSAIIPVNTCHTCNS